MGTGKRVKLSGQELEEHKRKEKEKEKVKEEVGDIDEDSSSDEEMEITTTKPTANLKNVKHDIILRVDNEGQLAGKRAFFKSTKSKYPMYPHYEEKIRWDDYGEIIKPEEWIDTSAVSNDNFDQDGNGPSDNIVDESNVDNTEIPT